MPQKLGITKGAIGNYESGISSPRIEIMFKFSRFFSVMLIIFQDEMVDLTEENASPEEMDELVKKYRQDEHGKQLVLDFIERTLEACQRLLSKLLSNFSTAHQPKKGLINRKAIQ
ncbi:MAG: helix-turn-helix domain-containing protein [Ruthenibacterium lactatiformans]